jgi:2,3-bisphosphoglycerate-independent phosphoglycerate mutase
MHRTFADRTGLSGAVISGNFLVRGLAKSLNLAWYAGPTSWEERSLEATAQSATRLISGRDFVYVHLAVTSADPVERLCAMERLDRVLLRACTGLLPRLGPWRLLVAVDDRTQGTVPFIACGTNVPKLPAVSLERAAFAGSPLSFADGAGWFAWLTATP